MPGFKRSAAGLAASLAACLLILASCSGGGGGSSPTDPGAPGPPGGPSGSAIISGQVASVSGSGVSGAASGAGLTVRIQGTSLSTTTGGDGRFSLASVPDGDRVLSFESAAQSAALPIGAIRPGERIEMTVQIRASTVTVVSMSRSPGGTSLSLEMQPDTWNTNWQHSSGQVSALIRGEGFNQIDPRSIVLVGTDPDAEPLAPTRVDVAGNHVRAFFRQADAFGTLDDPEPGDTHTVLVQFEAGGAPGELSDAVRIVGPRSGDDDDDDDDDDEVNLDLEIQPDSWNTNWVASSGTVSALIRGEGFEDVDLDSIVLVGTDPAASPLPAERADRAGNHVRAFFGKSEAIQTLDTPVRGEAHTVTIELTVDGEPFELTDQVRIVGPPG